MLYIKEFRIYNNGSTGLNFLTFTSPEALNEEWSHMTGTLEWTPITAQEYYAGLDMIEQSQQEAMQLLYAEQAHNDSYALTLDNTPFNPQAALAKRAYDLQYNNEVPF